jgi:hypothetical protein
MQSVSITTKDDLQQVGGFQVMAKVTLPLAR